MITGRQAVFLMKSIVASLLVGLWAGTAALQAASLEDIRFPENTRLQWIGRQMTHNGFPVSVLQFDSPLSAEQMVGEFRNRWEQLARPDMPGYVAGSYHDWLTISHLDGHENLVLQARPSPGGGSTGFFSLLNLSGNHPRVSANADSRLVSLGLPAGLETVSVTETEENGQQATTVLAVSQSDSTITGRKITNSMQRSGWHRAKGFRQQGVDVQFFSREDRQAEILIKDLSAGQSILWINLVNK